MWSRDTPMTGHVMKGHSDERRPCGERTLQWQEVICSRDTSMTGDVMEGYSNDRWCDGGTLRWQEVMWWRDTLMTVGHVIKRHSDDSRSCDQETLRWQEVMWSRDTPMTGGHVIKRHCWSYDDSSSCDQETLRWQEVMWSRDTPMTGHVMGGTLRWQEVMWSRDTPMTGHVIKGHSDDRRSCDQETLWWQEVMWSRVSRWLIGWLIGGHLIRGCVLRTLAFFPMSRNKHFHPELCHWSIYIWEHTLKEELWSGDPTSLPWPIWKLTCDWPIETKTKMVATTGVTKHLENRYYFCMCHPSWVWDSLLFIKSGCPGVLGFTPGRGNSKGNFSSCQETGKVLTSEMPFHSKF